MDRPWTAHSPPGVPAQIAVDAYPSLVALMEDSFSRHRDRPAFKFMGMALNFGELDKFDQLLDTPQDTIGLTLMNEQLPQRVRKPRKTQESGAF